MIGRSNGRSAVACAAYRAGDVLRDERLGQRHDYGPRRGILRTAILAPEGAPAWALDREKLWNRAEAAEKRKDAQVAREIELGLPHRVSPSLRTELVETFIREQLLPRGMIVDYAIHAPNRKGDERNFHAHLLTTTRSIEAAGFARLKDTEACSREVIHDWREAWSEIQNRTFEHHQIRDADGRILKVDHRSYEARGIDREPSIHLGVHANALERSGQRSERGDVNRAVEKLNELKELSRRAAELIREEERATRAANDDRDDGTRHSVRDRGYGHDR